VFWYGTCFGAGLRLPKFTGPSTNKSIETRASTAPQTVTGGPGLSEQGYGQSPDKDLVPSGSKIPTRGRFSSHSNLCKVCKSLDIEAVFSRAESELPIGAVALSIIGKSQNSFALAPRYFWRSYQILNSVNEFLPLRISNSTGSLEDISSAISVLIQVPSELGAILSLSTSTMP
jgi:hypothetical protein